MFVLSYFAESTLCVLFSLQVKLGTQNVEVCKVSKKIRLNPGVRARLHIRFGKTEQRPVSTNVLNCRIFCQVLHPGTLTSIYHRVSLSSSANCNLFSQQPTLGGCLSMEYSNKQLALTGSGSDVRNVSSHIVCFSLPPHSACGPGSEGRR